MISNKNILVLLICLMGCRSLYSQKVYNVDHFDKLIVSPHIKVTLMKGDREEVRIISNSEDDDKLNIEVNGKNLRIYLDDAKEVTKQEKVSVNGVISKKPIYNNTVVVAEVTYIELKDLSIRGEETFVSQGEFIGGSLDLNIYGESNVLFDQVSLEDLDVSIYGEAYLELKSGSVNYQKFTTYGDSKINSLNIENEETKLTAYGESQLEVNCKSRLKITCFGEPTIRYTGSPNVEKGLNIGGAKISKME